MKIEVLKNVEAEDFLFHKSGFLRDFYIMSCKFL